MRITVWLILLLTGSLISCRSGPPDTAPPSTEALAPFSGPAPLDHGLETLDQALDSLLRDGFDAHAWDRLTRLEVLSDRLLETRPPFAWLTASDYSLDSRLRQIQALADRGVALWRSGSSRTELLENLRDMRDHVQHLQADIARGGGPAPPSLTRLLSRLDTTRRGRAEAGGE